MHEVFWSTLGKRTSMHIVGAASQLNGEKNRVFFSGACGGVGISRQYKSKTLTSSTLGEEQGESCCRRCPQLQGKGISLFWRLWMG